MVDWLRDVSPWFHGNAGLGTTWHVTDLDLLRAIFPFMTAPSAGQYMAVGLIAGAWLLLGGLRNSTPGQHNITVVAVGLIGFALLLTFSRQSWVGALVGILFLTIRAHRASLLAAAIPFLLIAAIVPTPGGGGSFYGYIAHSAQTKSADDRIQLWKTALDISSANPVLGVGPGQYSELGADPTRAYYAHNMYLDQLVELGMAGGVLFLAYALTLLAAAWRRGASLAFAMLATYLVANIFDDTFYHARNGLAAAVIIGLLGAHGSRRVRGPPVAEERIDPPEPASRERVLVGA